MRVLAAIDQVEGSTIRERMRKVSDMTFSDEEGYKHRFTWRTIETWRCRYRKHGFTAISRNPRSDKGSFRKVSPEKVQEAIDQAKSFFRSDDFKISELYRLCIEKGLLQRDRVAPNTFRRIIRRYEMLKPDSQVSNKARLAFSKRHANECWQADTLFGPYIKTPKGVMKPSKLIAFIDDASRVCCHGEFFYEENSINFKSALKKAIYKRGLPRMLYVDNGSIYSTAELVNISGRIGCRLCHTPVRDGAAKGKVERFFRTVRDQFLTRKQNLNSLEALNSAFTQWVEDHYHHSTHSTLGMKPIERYGLDTHLIEFLPPNLYYDEIFMAEETRKVKADNTFSFKSIRYEAPVDLRNRQISIRFDQLPTGSKYPSHPLATYYKEQRVGESKPVDFLNNDRKPNTNQS